MNKLIMSGEKPELEKNITQFGYEIIESEVLQDLLPFEKQHADMQCLKIKDTYFVLKNCKFLAAKLRNLNLKVIETATSAYEKYPENILLNCLYIKNKLFCRVKSTDNTVIEFCNQENIQIINVNQGYAKCSTAVIDDSFITSDKGIFKALLQNGVEGILITPRGIQLDGVDYGFIGGCCFSDEHNVYFTGDITKHSDFEKIQDFCYKKNRNIICLSNKKLYDIGGFIAI